MQVRGSTAPLEELQYILHHSRSVGLVVQDAATLDRLLPVLTAAVRLVASSQSCHKLRSHQEHLYFSR